MSRTWHHGKRSPSYKWNRPDGNMYSETPGWWVTMFMTRPMRQRDRDLMQKVLSGYADADNVSFSLVRKPHLYYW